MIDIYINNNQSELDGNRKECNIIYEAFKVRHPNGFHLRRYMPKGWDGKIEFIRANGKFSTGLLQRVVDKCKELNIEVELVDERETDVKLNRKLVTEGLREYQGEALETITTNKIHGIRMPRGTIKAATNAGKTHISAAIHNQYKTKTIFLMNSKELYVDARKDMPSLITHGTIGWIDSKEIVWGDFMICMVATTRNRIKSIAHILKDYRALIVDEHDMADNKTNKTVIENLYNTIIRIGLSGTGNVSKLKKDLPKNWRLEGFFGAELYAITNRKLIDMGISSEVEVTFLKGFWGSSKATTGNWMEDMEEFIVKNSDRNKIVLKRSKYHWEQGRKSQLIVAQRKKHILRLYKRFVKHYGPEVKIDWVHSARKERLKITQEFMDGKLDILIGSMIIKRGKNFKKMDYMINAGGGKSPENILQLIGRAFRGCKFYEDFLDKGKYLAPHSRKRFIYYKNEKLKVNLPDGVKSVYTFNR